MTSLREEMVNKLEAEQRHIPVEIPASEYLTGKLIPLIAKKLKGVENPHITISARHCFNSGVQACINIVEEKDEQERS